MGKYPRNMRADMEAIEDGIAASIKAVDVALRALEFNVTLFSVARERATACYLETEDSRWLVLERDFKTAIKMSNEAHRALCDVRARNYPQGRLEGMADGE